MTKFLFTLFFISTISAVQAQTAPAIQWQKTLGGTKADNAGCVKQTKDGGYIVAGSTASNDSDVSGNHGGTDAWIVKLNSNGSIKWQKCYGGSNYDDAGYIEQTTDGGYIISGSTNSNDGDVSGYHVGVPYLYGDVWILKIDSLGNIQWQKCFGGSNNDAATEIHQTFDGGFIVIGYTESNDGNVVGQHQVTVSDMWVLKLDALGNLIWQKCFGGTDTDYGTSIKQTTEGGYILCGGTFSTNGDVKGNHGYNDGWLVKIDSAGLILWQKCFGGSGGESINSIEQTKDKGYVICGYTGGSNDGDLTGITTYGNDDYWIVKTDSIGNILWQKVFGGSVDDEAFSIQQTSEGGYVIIGYAKSDSSTYGNVNNNHGLYDYWVLKTDSVGNLLWQKCFGGSKYDNGYFIQQTSDNGFIMCGISYSSDGDLSIHYGSNQDQDFWVVKLMPDILPLSILSFKAAPPPPEGGIKGNALLNWVTTDEVNVDHFNIERSVDGKTFETIGMVRAKGGGCYLYLDQAPPPPKGGISYYRLEVVDKNGSISYSEVREVEIRMDKVQLKIYPNPAKEYVVIDVSNIKEIHIFNSLGQVISTKVDNTNMLHYRIDIKSLIRGIYTVQVVHNDGTVRTEKLIIE